MVANIKTFFRLLKLYAKLDLVWFLRDTKYCLLFMVSDVIGAIAMVSGVLLLSVRFGGFGGMNQAEVLFMLGYGMTVDGIYMMVFGSNNIGQISRIIGRGQIDHCMIQPVSLPIQWLSSGFMPVSGSSVLVCGIGITWYSITKIGMAVSGLWIVGLFVSLICSALIIMSAIYLISCMAFYAPSAAEEIAQVGVDLFDSLKSYPLGGLSATWQTVFCTIIPVGLAAWFPSKVLLGQTPDGLFGGLQFPALTMTATAIFIIITTFVFRKGMKHYATYGSPRYSGFGHR